MFRSTDSRISLRRAVVVSAMAVLLCGAVGCNRRESSRAGGANTPDARANRKLAEESILESVQVAMKEHVAQHGEPKKGTARGAFTSAIVPQVTVAANAAPPASPEPAAPNPPPFKVVISSTKTESRAVRPSSPAVISERVTTEIPYPSESEADARTLEEAQKMIEKRLKELDPPVEYLPPVAVVMNEYVKRDSRLVRLPTDNEKTALKDAGYDADRRYVEYTVELREDQIRELRTRNRVADALRGLGAIAAISLAGFLFLRLDEWSKGYLTSWLALGAAGLAGGVIAAVVLV